jgi:4-carboxymuconolactone decarboxylase
MSSATDQTSDGGAPRAPSSAGDAMRRRVLGDEHVDRAWARATELTRPLQQFATDFCWDAIWTRPGLELKTRSLLNIAMLTALGKSDELRAHVRGALRNGTTVDELREVLMQSAVYCGLPAALDAARHAQAVLEESGQ